MQDAATAPARLKQEDRTSSPLPAESDASSPEILVPNSYYAEDDADKARFSQVFLLLLGHLTPAGN